MKDPLLIVGLINTDAETSLMFFLVVKSVKSQSSEVDDPTQLFSPVFPCFPATCGSMGMSRAAKLQHDRPLTKRKSCGRSTKDVETLNREIREAVVFDGTSLSSWGIFSFKKP